MLEDDATSDWIRSSVVDRLLSAPALTEDQVRQRGGDPGDPFLIRLDRHGDDRHRNDRHGDGRPGDGRPGDDRHGDDRHGGSRHGDGWDGDGAAGEGAGGGGWRWPEFQFAADGGPLPVVRAINELLDAAADPVGTADWWLSRNGWLDAQPSLLIGAVADDVLVQAARAIRSEV